MSYILINKRRCLASEGLDNLTGRELRSASTTRQDVTTTLPPPPAPPTYPVGREKNPEIVMKSTSSLFYGTMNRSL